MLHSDGKLHATGFPSPADDFADRPLDLHQHLVQNSNSSFFMRMEGDRFSKHGVLDQDLLIIDRSVQPKEKSLIIMANEESFSIDHFYKKEFIADHNKAENFWGVVTYIIHKCQ